MKPLTGILAKPWWEENIDPRLTPPEVLELLDRDFPEHPARERISRAAQGYEKALSRPLGEETYLCPACKDIGWRETDATGRGTFARCNGPMASGCRYESHRRAEAAKKAARKPVGESGETTY